MRKQLELIKKLLIIVIMLTIFQLMLLLIAPDLKHIILTSVVVLGLALIIIFYIITKKEVNNIIFENENDQYKIRLVEYDDFIKIRELVDTTPLENTEEEKQRLEEFEAITVDYVRTKYHYLILINDVACALFYAKKENGNWSIKIINTTEDKNKVKDWILNNTRVDKLKVTFDE